MSRGWLSATAIFCLAALAAPATSGATGALVAVNGLVLRANGTYEPTSLPRHRFAPIEFQGRANVVAKDGGRPPALEQAVIQFDKDGHLDVNGLPRCQLEQVSALGVAEARGACRNAIVGKGTVDAMIELDGLTVGGSAPLTIFNGPPVEGNPSVILHSRVPFPFSQTLAVLAPIEREPGPFRYRVPIVLPPIAEGAGSITGIDADVGRRFRSGGKLRSYVAARCSDGVLQTHGRFTFADGTIIDGAVEKGCTPLPLSR